MKKNMSQLCRLVKEVERIEEFKKTVSRIASILTTPNAESFINYNRVKALCPTFDIVETFDERWTVSIHGPIDSRFEGMVIPFSLMFNDDFPFSAPFITCLETVDGTNFLKNEVMTFNNFRYKKNKK